MIAETLTYILALILTCIRVTWQFVEGLFGLIVAIFDRGGKKLYRKLLSEPRLRITKTIHRHLIRYTNEAIAKNVASASLSHAKVPLHDTETQIRIKAIVAEYETKTAPRTYLHLSHQYKLVNQNMHRIWRRDSNTIKEIGNFIEQLLLFIVACAIMFCIVTISPVKSTTQIREYRAARRLLLQPAPAPPTNKQE